MRTITPHKAAICMDKKNLPLVLSPKDEIFEILRPYQLQIDEEMRIELPSLGEPGKLREACEYVLLSPGKRFRPALVMMIAKGIGYEGDATYAALAVEYFHTASLVADDLPCMDDDDLRRDKPTVHKIYGEATALLVSYALIAAGYKFLTKNAETLRQLRLPFSYDSNHICTLAIESASYNTGIFGATGGQFLDIYPPNLSISTLKEIIYKKTTSLFELSFVLGWLFGGGEIARLPFVKTAALHFGMAFQIADDIGDMDQDIKNKRAVNIANVIGLDAAVQMFHEELHQFERIINELQFDSKELIGISNLLKHSLE